MPYHYQLRVVAKIHFNPEKKDTIVIQILNAGL
jgi:hypothetical protein